MAQLKNLISVLVFSFLLLGAYQAKAAPSCIDKDRHVKDGDFDSAPGQRVLRFKNLRDDLQTALESGEADKAKCLYEAYDKAAQEEAGFWQAKAAAEGCDIEKPSECPDPETPRSLKFLESMHHQLEAKLKTDLEKIDKTEAAATCTEGCDQGKDDKLALAELRTNQCCGTKDGKKEEEIGVIRQHYPSLSYNQCLEKSDKNRHASGLETAGSCIKGLVSSVLKGMLDGVVGFFKLPGELWAARSQIWSIMTDRDYASQFFEHIKNSLLEFIGVQSGDLTNCLNDESRTKYYCENAGEVVGLLASPALIGNIFKIAKLGVKAAAQLMKMALNSTARGARVMARIAKGVEKTVEVIDKGKKYVRKKVATGALIVGLTMETSKIAKLIIKAGSPFARGAVRAKNFLAPAVRVGGKVISLPAKMTNKGIDWAVAQGFNAGKKVVASMAAKKGVQVITAGAAGTGTATTGLAAAGTADAGTAAAAASKASTASTAGSAGGAGTAGSTGSAAKVATTAHGAPLEPMTPPSTSGKPTTIRYEPPRPRVQPNANPQAEVPIRKSGIQVLPRVEPTATNPTGNPYVGTPQRNLRVNLDGTAAQIKRVEQQLAANPTDAALLERQKI